MGKIRTGPDPKAALVSEICSLSRSPISCTHINRNSGSCFIDWYLILGIQEDAEVKLIRKRYHKLALKVHPDKNNHPRADFAFKLVHEAYLCLSDETKRRSFNAERRNHICIICSRVSHKTKENRTDTKPKQNRFCQTLRDIRDKFREENKVIERCLKTNSTRFMANRTEEAPVFGVPNRNRFNKETPVFNPTDYSLWGYPHVRDRVLDNNLSDWRKFMRSRSTCVHS